MGESLSRALDHEDKYTKDGQRRAIISQSPWPRDRGQAGCWWSGEEAQWSPLSSGDISSTEQGSVARDEDRKALTVTVLASSSVK